MNKLLILEGADASGKTTQAKKLVEEKGFVELRLPNYDFFSGKLIKKANQTNKEGVAETSYQLFQMWIILMFSIIKLFHY